jgi:hypothetical protein
MRAGTMAGELGLDRLELSCGAASAAGIGPAGEERPVRGNCPVTTPCHFPGRSALRHAGYAVGSRAEGDR